VKIVDCHVHVNHYPHRGDVAKSLEAKISTLLQAMDSQNINYSLILSSYKVNQNRPSTAQIIKHAKKYESRIGVVASFTIDNGPSSLSEYRNWFKDDLIEGIKLYCGYEHYYPYDKRYQGIYDICIEYKKPVMIHTGDTYASNAKIRFAHPLNIDEVAVDNPELKIVICHLGNPWTVDCQEVLFKNKNVYADISGLFVGDISTYDEIYYARKINELLRYVGDPHRLLYGSDWPLCDMGAYIKFVKRLELDNYSKDLLMSGNAVSLFSL
jgi:predicted TIM-barrel fold metal-dependent hydrolase